MADWWSIVEDLSQFLWELHFIEARSCVSPLLRARCRSSFGNCTSLRRDEEVRCLTLITRCRSSFGNCTSLRLVSRPRAYECA